MWRMKFWAAFREIRFCTIAATVLVLVLLWNDAKVTDMFLVTSSKSIERKENATQASQPASSICHNISCNTNHTEVQYSANPSAQSNKTSPYSSVRKILENEYPECVAPQEIIDLAQVGLYLPTENRSKPPRYNHVSCFVMKARYNCAYRPHAPFTMAHHFELVLRFPSSNLTLIHNHTQGTNASFPVPDTSKDCRLSSLVDSVLGGPAGLWTHSNKTDEAQRKHHILLQGNSYVRQLWEALTCGFQSQITDLLVQHGGPGIGLRDFSQRKNRPIETVDLGQPLWDHNLSQIPQQGCHGETKSDISKYYRKKAIKPPNRPYCNDNVAMVEFDNRIRFNYLFKPTMYAPKTLEHIHEERLGIQRELIEMHSPDQPSHYLVWNYAMKEAQNITPKAFEHPQAGSESPMLMQELNVESWLWTLRDLQLRDLGYYYGANNPWVKKPPDYHPCMPGIPDDQINLLLYLLWTGYAIL